MPPTVSFVIVNYNGANCLPGCLQSAFSQTRPPDEVIVVDNRSGDGSPGAAQRLFPQRLKLIELERNVGYAAACNRGIEESSGDFVAILNNDIVLELDWLEALLSRDEPTWDFWASQIVFDFDPSRIDSAGDGMAVVGAAYKIGHGEAAARHQKEREVFGPCAAAALYRRKLLEEAGGFDDDFFLIYEDADLNFRARLLGGRCLYVPTARVRHQVNASIGAFSDTYVFYGHRNSEYVFWKCMPFPLLALYLPERILFDLLSFFFFMSKGKARAFLRAKWDFLRNFRAVWAKRRALQGLRQLETSAVRRLLDRNWLRNRRKVLKQS